MERIPLRELRNDTSDVLRRVQAGAHLRVTISGQEVAEIVPLPQRRRYLSWAELASSTVQADVGLSAELAELVPDSTDDAPI